MPDLSMRPAVPAEAPALMHLRIEAEEWLAAAGIDQWRSPGFRDRALAKWEADVAAGRTWVAADAEGCLAGTVTLAGPDHDFWKLSDQPDAALYVAKLITSRRFAGQRLGGRMLDWVGRAARARCLPWVRLDVWRSNTQLQDYYLAEGFTHVRTEAPSHRLSGWMAQRPASVVMHPALPLPSQPLAEALGKAG